MQKPKDVTFKFVVLCFGACFAASQVIGQNLPGFEESQYLGFGKIDVSEHVRNLVEEIQVFLQPLQSLQLAELGHSQEPQ